MGQKVKTFRDLIVWQKAHQLTLSIYEISKSFPSEEKFGLTSQMRRSASSIPTNIVEGHRRKSKKDFLHFLNIADSSLEELKYHLILAKDLNYITNKIHERMLGQSEEVGRLLYSFREKLAF